MISTNKCGSWSIW